MSNKYDPAFPLQPTFNSYGEVCNERYAFEGLTKREYFAGMAMQGLCARRQAWDNMKELADKAIEIADAILDKLEKPQP